MYLGICLWVYVSYVGVSECVIFCMCASLLHVNTRCHADYPVVTFDPISVWDWVPKVSSGRA